MKLVDTVDAVGHILCHDITQIIPGEKKGVVFKKGHIVEEKDIEVLLSVGKVHLYVWENNENMLHEDDAAYILKDICIKENDNIIFNEPSEGKIEMIADMDGVLKIDSELLCQINGLGQMMIATIKGNFPVKKGDKIAGCRIIPLVIEKEKMDEAKRVAGDKKIISIIPLKKKKYGIVTTGNEVASGIIKDAFGPVIKSKLNEYNCDCIGQKILPDNKEKITESILEFIKSGADLVICSGGMSVDPDDQTPGAIKDTGAKIISYGAPVLPGAMFLLSYYNYNNKIIPIIGLPGCVMYNKRTVFDLILPRVLAEEKLECRDLSVLGEGGLCLNCKICHFPNCSFGR